MKNKALSFIRWNALHVWYEYGFLALLILLPMLVPGYILTLDLVFTPHIAWPIELTSAYPLDLLLWLWHFVLSADVIEKCILFGILLCSGVGMYYLFESFTSEYNAKNSISHAGAYFAGLFYMINPFVYSRFMAGQWMVLLGYALLPFFIRSLFVYITSPSYARAIRTGLWIFALVTVSIHQIGILGIPLVGMVALGWWRRRSNVVLFRYWKGVAVMVGIPLILSLFWLVPAIIGGGAVGQAVADFNANDFAAFSTVGGIGSVLRLQGFWVEARDLYVLPQSVVPLWGVGFLLIWALVLGGAKKYWKTYRSIVFLALLCIGAGVVLAVTPFIEWISQTAPQVAGYREPHKFVMLVALGFSLLGGLGLLFIVQKTRAKSGETLVGITKVAGLLLPVIITPVMFWGFSGQLAPKHYPDDWYEINQTLKDEAGDKKTLFLPWHQYGNYSFSGRIIANPAEKFFEVPTIASDEPEFRGVSSTTPDSIKQQISSLLKLKQPISKKLNIMGIGYIIVAKEQDYAVYSYLDKDAGLQLLKDYKTAKLYKVMEQ